MPEPPHVELHDGSSFSLKDMLATIERHGDTFEMPEGIDGINRIGSLGTDYWGRDQDASEKLSDEDGTSRESGSGQGGQQRIVLSHGSNLFSSSGLESHTDTSNYLVKNISGDLVPGVNTFEKLPTMYWGQESNGKIFPDHHSPAHAAAPGRTPEPDLPGAREVRGPVVSVYRASEEVAYEAALWSGVSQKHIFRITLKQYGSADNDYASPDGSGLLLQDVTIELRLSGSAEYGEDYGFVPSAAMQALIDAGKMTCSGPDAAGRIVLVLHGQYDASGVPSGKTPFDLAELDALRFEAPALPDSIQEGREEILLSIVSVTGNAAQIGVPEAAGAIEDGEEASLLVTVDGGTVNESEGYAAFTVTAVVPEGSGFLLFSLEGVTATSGMDYTPTLEYYDGAAWVSARIVDGKFEVPVSGSGPIRIRVPLIDDHMSEGDETIRLTVEEMTFNGHDIKEFGLAGNLRADSVIRDDSVPGSGRPGIAGELDGPVVSVYRTSDEVAYEKTSSWTGASQHHSFLITLTRPGASVDYTNPDGSGLLLQDVTIELRLSGTASYGDDYGFAPSAAMQALIDAGKMTCSGPDATGRIVLVLHGQYDASGVPSGKTPFDLAELDALRFEAPVLPDSAQEGREEILLSIVSVTGNEAQIGVPGAAGAIEDREGLGFTVTVDGGTVNESEGYASFTVTPDVPAGSGALLLSLEGVTATSGMDYTPALEYYDGTAWVSAQIVGGKFEVPVSGSGPIRIRVPLIDDQLSESDETVRLTVESMTYNGEAIPDSDLGGTRTADVTITEDSQPGSGVPGIAGELDGPVVSVYRTSDEVAYEKTYPWTGASQHHSFLITLTQPGASVDYANPDGSGLLLQDVTIELRLSGTAAYGDDYGFAPSAAMQALIDAGKMTCSGPDASGRIVLVLHGQYDASGAPSGKTPFDLAELDALRFEAPVLPDSVQEGREEIQLSIVSVTGNEAQIGVPDAAGAIEDREGPALTVTVDGGTVNESEGYASFTVTPDVPAGSGALLLSLEGVTATSGMDYTPALEYHDGTAWVSAQIVGGKFEVPVSGAGPIQIRVPLIDDHLSETDETVRLTVESMTYNGEAIPDSDLGGARTADVTITEDTLPGSGTPGVTGELDGPVVSVDRTSNPVEFEEPGGVTPPGTHTFLLSLKECGASGDYAGTDGSGELPQDLTITLKLDGTAQPGPDYIFGPSAAMQALIDAGKMTCTGPDASGAVTVVLHGQYGPDGSPSGHTPFDLADLARLTFDASIIADHIPEALESIRLSIVSVSGNEAQIGKDTDRGMIADDPGRQHGPVITIASPGSAAESGAVDPWNAPADNTVWHTISLDLATPEDIRALITLTGENGAALFTGSNAGQADFAWADQVQYTTDGMTWHTLTGGHSYDPVTGKAALTIPQGARGVRFGVRVIDDMRETSDGAGEGYKVTLELVKENGLADAGAVLGSGTFPQQSLDTSTLIVPDTRPVGDLNPADFDGPFVVLAADPAREGLETNGSGKHYARESSGTLPFTLSLHAPDGTSALFAGSEENVIVTLTINGGAGFQVRDLFEPDASGLCGGTIPYTIYNDDGSVARTGVISLSNLTGTDASLTITLTFPPGCNKITFDLPVNDDPLGVSDTSLLDRFEEQVTVTVTGVTGNEARVDDARHPDGSSASLLIRDDAADDPTATTDDASLEGVRVGLEWKAGTVEEDNGTFLTEGKTGVILIKLYDALGTAVTQSAANSPYANYTLNGKLPEDLAISLSFADTQGVDTDLSLRFSSEFIQLVSAGKVTVEIDGTTYDTGNFTLLNSLDVAGNFTVTLKGGQFDLYTDQASLGFNAHATGDNVSEFNKDGGYLSQAPAADESFGLGITSVKGNESVVKHDAREVEAVITDAADGVLTLAGGDITSGAGSLGGYWSYAVSLAYADGEKANAPGVSAHGQGVIAGTAVKLPGEDVIFKLRVTDSAIMQHGEEYTVSAYDLFLSVNNLAEGGSGVPSRADYGDGNGYTPGAGGVNWIIVSLDADWSAGGNGLESSLYTLHVPTGYWGTTAGQNGIINFDIQQGDNACVSTTSGNGGFTLALEAPEVTNAVPDWDMKGEILHVAGGVISAEEDAIRIELALKPDPTIYENFVDAAHTNVAVYTLDFSQWRGTTQLAGDLRLACDITFDFNLKPMGALFNENTLENTLYDSMGDFALCDSAGKIYPYKWGLDPADPNSLQSVLQAILDIDYGGNVRVVVSHDGSEFKFSFTVKEGTNLENGINLHFAAMDDNLSEAGEKFGGQISNVQSDGNAIPIKITQNGGRTEILDEPEDVYSGYAIALGEGAGYEKLVDAAMALKDGKGYSIDGKVHMPLYAYILSSGNAFSEGSGTTNMLDGVPDGTILTLANLVAVYLQQTGNTVSDPATDTAFQQFVIDHFRPTQDITLSVRLTSGGATVNEDFKDMTEQVIPHQDGGGNSTWVLKIDGDKIYFVNELLIDTLNDYTQNGGLLDFTVELTGSEGNESRLVTQQEIDGAEVAAGHDTERDAKIYDYHDGPAIIGFGPVVKELYEPVDTAHNGIAAAAKANVFAIELDRITEQDMILWLNIEEKGGTDSSDYYFGPGIWRYDGSGQYTTWDAAGTPQTVPQASLASLFTGNVVPAYFNETAMTAGSYFCVIKAGESSTSFQILVTDDNREELNDSLAFAIETVQGGESTFMDNDCAIPWDNAMPYRYAYDSGSGVMVEVLVDPVNQVYYEIVGGVCGAPVTWFGTPPAWLPAVSVETELRIVDDGFGPVVKLDSNSLTWNPGEDAPSFTLNIQDVCQEVVDVIVVLNLNGESHELTFSIAAGALGSVILSASDVLTAWQNAGGTTLDRATFTGTVDLHIKNSLKGETIPDHTPQRVVIYGAGTDVIELYDLENMTITEALMPGDTGVLAADGFKLKMAIPSLTAIKSGGLSFTLDLANPSNSPLDSDTATKYKVTFTEVQLQTLQGMGSTFQLEITTHHDGNPKLVVTVLTGGSGTVQYGSNVFFENTGTDMPTAKGDDIIGDHGEITVSINDVAGAQIRPGSDSVKSVVIQDGTYATVKFFMETDTGWVLVENNADLAESLGIISMKVVLVLTDAAGNVIYENNTPGNTLEHFIKVHTTRDLEFTIHHQEASSDGTTYGEDYTVSSSVRIGAGESSGDFKLTITQDERTEGNNGREGFSLHLEPTAETAAVCGKEMGHITGDNGGEFGNTDLFIRDDNSGPSISWDLDKTTMPEGDAFTITWESIHNGGRQVVVEDVEIVFHIEPGPGFTSDEIESITVNGLTYTTGTAPLLSSILNTGGAVWVLTLPDGMPANTGINSLTITLKDDVKTEGNEKLTITLHSVNGGETDIAADSVLPKEVTVTDTLDGGQIDLVIDAANSGEEYGQVAYTLTLASDGKEIQEDTVVTLTVNAASRAHIDESGSFTITLPGGGGVKTVTVGSTPADPSNPSHAYYYDTTTGKLTVTLPPGCSGTLGHEISIKIPVFNDSLAAEREFGLALTDVKGGEMSQAPSLAYGSQFIQEKGADSEHGGNGGMNEFAVSVNSLPPNCHGALRFEVGGIADPSVVKMIILDGVTLAEGTDWEWNGNNIRITTASGEMKTSYNVKIYYEAGADPEHLQLTKRDIGIENAGLIGREVVTTIGNETTQSLWTGPVASLDMTSFASSVEEGDTMAGTLVLAMPDLAADGGKLLEAVKITLTVPDAYAFTTDLGTVTRNNATTVTITIPKNTVIPGDGKILVNFDATVPDNCLTTNDSATVTITGITKPGNALYEAYGVDSVNATVTLPVTDNSTDSGPHASLTAMGPGSAPDTYDVNILIALPAGAPATLVETLVVTLQLTGDYDTAAHPSGTVTVTIPAGASLSGGTFSVAESITVDGMAVDPAVSAAITAVSASGDGSNAYETADFDGTLCDLTTAFSGFMFVSEADADLFAAFGAAMTDGEEEALLLPGLESESSGGILGDVPHGGEDGPAPQDPADGGQTLFAQDPGAEALFPDSSGEEMDDLLAGLAPMPEGVPPSPIHETSGPEASGPEAFVAEVPAADGPAPFVESAPAASEAEMLVLMQSLMGVTG